MITKREMMGDMPQPAFIMLCKSDFKFFCERCLGVTTYGGIHDFQMTWFNAAQKYKRLIIESGTGSSKTQVMGAMYPVWVMFCNSNKSILLVNKTMEQGKANLLSRIKMYIEDNELLTELLMPEDRSLSWNVKEIKTKNGHVVKNVPYNDNIRGYRADLIILDEIDSYDDTNIFFEHVVSRLHPTGQLVGISTPTGHTKIIGQLKEKDKAGLIKNYKFIKTPYLVDSYGKPAKITNREEIHHYSSIWPEMWSVDKLYQRWGEEGKSNWMRNIMCEALGELDDAIFPIVNIVTAYDYKMGFSEGLNPNAQYFIGADFAISDGPKADSDAFTVIEKVDNQFIIKYMETHKGWQLPEKVNRLSELFNRYYSELGTYLIVDESNMGTMVMNELRGKGIPVIAQNFHSASRANLLITLSSVLSGKKLIIPRNPNAEDDCIKYSEMLKDQLSGFRRTRSEKTGKELIESRASHDDLAMSTAMAICEAVKHDTMDLMPLSA
jgi:phage terminase large subunit-like protein